MRTGHSYWVGSLLDRGTPSDADRCGPPSRAPGRRPSSPCWRTTGGGSLGGSVMLGKVFVNVDSWSLASILFEVKPRGDLL